MDWFVRLFLKSALVSLGVGIVMGSWMALSPGAIIYRPAHVHLNLLGFVSMVIYGVAYHVIPRFTGHPLHNRRMAGVHWWCANIGLIVLVSGFLFAPHMATPARALMGAGAAVAGLGAFLFIYNLWRTIDGRVAMRPPAPDSRALPIAG